MKKYFPIILVLLFTSCKKEKQNKIIDENQQTIEEQFVSEFLDFETEGTVHIRGIQNCESAQLYLTHGFRLAQGVEYNGGYYYHIEKSIYFRNCDTLLFDSWQALNGFYRYSFETKKSYYYQDLNDANPTLLFDFNCNVGDTILMDQSCLVKMLVTSVTEENIGGITFPKIQGEIISISKNGLVSSELNTNGNIYGTLNFLPYSANPFWYGQNFYQLLNFTWNTNQFCGQVIDADLDDVELICKNTNTNLPVYNYKIYWSW